MNSAEAREYVRLATTETKGRTKTACDLLITESAKLEKIEQIIEKYGLSDVTRDDVDNTVSGFEYEIIQAVLGSED